MFRRLTMDATCLSLFEADADLIRLILIMAFFAYLGALIVIVYFSRKQSQVHVSATSQSPQLSKQTGKTKQSRSNAPKQFRHIMTVPSFDKAKLIVEQLQEKGLRYTLEGNEDGLITLHYTSSEKANLEKLKRKGIILDGKIQEVKEETDRV